MILDLKHTIRLLKIKHLDFGVLDCLEFKTHAETLKLISGQEAHWDLKHTICPFICPDRSKPNHTQTHKSHTSRSDRQCDSRKDISCHRVRQLSTCDYIQNKKKKISQSSVNVTYQVSRQQRKLTKENLCSRSEHRCLENAQQRKIIHCKT